MTAFVQKRESVLARCEDVWVQMNREACVFLLFHHLQFLLLQWLNIIELILNVHHMNILSWNVTRASAAVMEKVRVVPKKFVEMHRNHEVESSIL